MTNVEGTPPGRIELGAGPTDDEIDVGGGGCDALSVAELGDLRSHRLAHLRDGAANEAAIVGGWEDAGDIAPKLFPVGVDGGPEVWMARERAEDVVGHAGRAAEGDGGGGGEVGVELSKEAEAGELGGIALAPGTEAGDLVADGDTGDESPVDGGFGVAGCDGVGGEGADGFVFGIGPSGAVGRRSAAESVDGSGGEDGGPAIVMEFASHAAWERGKGGVGVGECLKERRLRGALRESVVVAEAERGDEVGGPREGDGVGGRGVCGLSRCRGLGGWRRWSGMGERRSCEGAGEEFDEGATRCGALLRRQLGEEVVGGPKDGRAVEFVEGISLVIEDKGGAVAEEGASGDDVRGETIGGRETELATVLTVRGGSSADATDGVGGPGSAGCRGSGDRPREGFVRLGDERGLEVAPGSGGGVTSCPGAGVKRPEGSESFGDGGVGVIELEDEPAGPTAEVGGTVSLGASPAEDGGAGDGGVDAGASGPPPVDPLLLGLAGQLPLGLDRKLGLEDVGDEMGGGRSGGDAVGEEAVEGAEVGRVYGTSDSRDPEFSGIEGVRGRGREVAPLSVGEGGYVVGEGSGLCEEDAG